MVNHHPANFGGHRHCGSGDMMFLVVEGRNSKCPLYYPSWLFISKGHGLKVYNISNSDPGRTRLKQQLGKKITTSFVSLFKKGEEKVKEKEN